MSKEPTEQVTNRKRRQREKNSCGGLFKQVECWVHPADIPALREKEKELQESRRTLQPSQ